MIGINVDIRGSKLEADTSYFVLPRGQAAGSSDSFVGGSPT